MDFEELRVEYESVGLSPSEVAPSPFEQFRDWIAAAIEHGVPGPNTMMLATADADARPSVRAVLLKGFSEKGLVFFTNYESSKGKDLAENPVASVAFLWQPLHRQVRVSGRVSRVASEVSDAYFDSRPELARRGAIASPQSRSIPEGWLLGEVEDTAGDVRPNHWGGYRIEPEMFEFWQGQPSRLHDRVRYLLNDGIWSVDRLAP